jgi:hypothetical protein
LHLDVRSGSCSLGSPAWPLCLLFLSRNFFVIAPRRHPAIFAFFRNLIRGKIILNRHHHVSFLEWRALLEPLTRSMRGPIAHSPIAKSCGPAAHYHKIGHSFQPIWRTRRARLSLAGAVMDPLQSLIFR